MDIYGSSAFYSGLSTIQTGQNRVDQAAGKISQQGTLEPKPKHTYFHTYPHALPTQPELTKKSNIRAPF